MESDVPKVIHCRDKEPYDELKKDGPLEDFEYPAIFMMAVSLGYNEGERLENGTNSDWLTRTEYLGDEHSKQRWILRSIAVQETGNLTDLKNGKKIIKIAQEYANSGILILKDMAFKEHGSLDKKLEAKIRRNLQSEMNL